MGRWRPSDRTPPRGTPVPPKERATTDDLPLIGRGRGEMRVSFAFVVSAIAVLIAGLGFVSSHLFVTKVELARAEFERAKRDEQVTKILTGLEVRADRTEERLRDLMRAQERRRRDR